MRHPRFVAFLVLVCLLAGWPASAQQAVILGPDLEPRVLTLQSYSPEGVGVIDDEGNAAVLPTDEVLRITLTARPEQLSDEAVGVARLRDGQVLVGEWRGAGGDTASVRWPVAADREAALSLDDLLSITLDRAVDPPAPGDDDLLRVATGETLAGYTEYVGDAVVGFVVGDADDPIEIPLENVVALTLANTPTPAEARPGLARVELLGGSVLLLADAAIGRNDAGRYVMRGDSTLPIEPAGLELPVDTLRQIEPLIGRYRLTPLSGYAMTQVAGGVVFGVPMPPSVDRDGAVRLHAPTTIGFDLPRGATRLVFKARLELGEDVPQQRRALAGCELVVFAGGERVGGCTLSPDQPAVRVNAPLGKGPLRIEARPGVNGPVLDRVVLTEAEVLVSGP